jgi:hypothetical protein
MKLILGEGSNATLFRSEEGGSDDEDSDGEEEDADFESAANLQYLRLGKFQIISGVSLIYVTIIRGSYGRALRLRKRTIRIRR